MNSMTSFDFWKMLASDWAVIYGETEKMQTDNSIAEYFSVADKVHGGVPNLLDAINDLMEDEDGDYK